MKKTALFLFVLLQGVPAMANDLFDTVTSGVSAAYTLFKNEFSKPLSYETDISNAIIILLGISVYMVLAWILCCMNKRSKPPKVEYDISHLISPIECYVRSHHERSDDNLVSVHIVEMLQKGFLKIDKVEYSRKDEPIFHLSKTDKKAYMPDERAFIKSFPEKIILDETYNYPFARYVFSFASKYYNQYRKEYSNNRFLIWIGTLFFVALLYFTPRPIEITNFAVLPIAILIYTALNSVVPQMVILGCAIIWYLIGLPYKEYIFSYGLLYQGIACCAIIFVLFPFFAKIICVPKKHGLERYSKIMGLKIFLERLDIKTPVSFTKERAEALYPYALALDLGEKWRKRFEQIMGKSLTEQTIYNKNFYDGLSTAVFDSIYECEAGCDKRGIHRSVSQKNYGAGRKRQG